MKNSSRQYITLSIMVAVLFLLVSLMPSNNNINSSSTAAEQGVKTLGLVTTDEAQKNN